MTSRSITDPPAPPASLPRTPAICFNTVVLRDFLLKSRRYSDDSIETHLNALLPTRRLFSTPTPTILEAPHCKTFILTQLFPTWADRDGLLEYCETLAEKPVAESVAHITPLQPEVSERVDPYARRKKEVWEKHDELKRVIRQERGVEAVIRMRTWEVIVRRCQLEGIVGSDWEKEMDLWRRQGGDGGR